MNLTRRSFLNCGLRGGAAGLTAVALAQRSLLAPLARYAARKGVRFRVGAPDWNLRLTAKPESVALAKKIGFDGVQISIGRKMELNDKALQQAFLAESKREGFPISSLCLDILHVNG